MKNLRPTATRAPISIDTIFDFKRYGYSLEAYCDRCFRHHEFNIDQLITIGHGETSIVNIKPRCSGCGDLAQKIVSPFRPKFTGYPR